MPAGKHPAKAVDKEFRRLGASRSTVRDGAKYLFPDGASIFIPSKINWFVAHSAMRDARMRMGADRERDPIMGERIPTTRLPAVDIDKLTVTDHARERLVMMRGQGDVADLEVLTALTCPMRALWSEQHGTYAWIGDRITVVGHYRDGWLTVRSFLWSTNDLWEQHPRPEKENAK